MRSPKKVAFLSALYFVQGLPFGFQANALPNYLRATGIKVAYVLNFGESRLAFRRLVLTKPNASA